MTKKISVNLGRTSRVKTYEKETRPSLLKPLDIDFREVLNSNSGKPLKYNPDEDPAVLDLKQRLRAVRLYS